MQLAKALQPFSSAHSARFALAAALAFLAPSLIRADDSAAKTHDVETVKDVAYYDGPNAHPVKHKLDLYLPKGARDFPVLVFVHGGAWVQGDKNFLGIYAAVGRCFARAGIGTVVTNYRLSPGVQHPEHVKDVARAFAWTYKNIAKHGGRRDRIFLCGHSAGGHLVSLLATDERYLKAEGLTFTAIRGVMPISGVYEIPAVGLAKIFGTDPEVKKQASPLRQVKAGLPPFLILYAEHDFPDCGKVPSERFCKALKDKGNRAETKEIKNSDHMRIILRAGNADDPVFTTLVQFVRANSDK